MLGTFELGGARADARHRDLHAGALPVEHRARPELSELWKDVFLFHWKEESQHAILDELEWRREHARLDAAERDRGVDDLIALVGAVDGILQAQARADADYFMSACGPRVPTAREPVRDTCSRPTAGSTSSSACRSRAS